MNISDHNTAGSSLIKEWFSSLRKSSSDGLGYEYRDVLAFAKSSRRPAVVPYFYPQASLFLLVIKLPTFSSAHWDSFLKKISMYF